MNTKPSRAVMLFGTEEPVTTLRILNAGALTAELDAGNLRHIRYGGLEVIRAVSFIVRDHNWGTYNPVIENLSIEEKPDRFTVTYTASAQDERQSFRYSARIEGTADGRLEFVATGSAETDFLTNRTGFVVLHPSGVAGRPVTIEHVDGAIEEGRFRRPSIHCSRCSICARSRTRRRPACASPAAWKATSTRWRISATGRMPPTRPMCVPSPCPGPIRLARANGSTRQCGSL